MNRRLSPGLELASMAAASDAASGAIMPFVAIRNTGVVSDRRRVERYLTGFVSSEIAIERIKHWYGRGYAKISRASPRGHKRWHAQLDERHENYERPTDANGDGRINGLAKWWGNFKKPKYQRQDRIRESTSEHDPTLRRGTQRATD